MGDIRKDIPSSPLRYPVKINIYKRSRVIVDTLNDNKPNRSGQDKREIKDKNEDEAEVENKNKDKTEIERSQRDQISFSDEKRDEELDKNLNNNLYSHGENDDWAEN